MPVHFPPKNKPSITLRPLGALPRQLRGLGKAGDLSDGKVLVTVRIISDTTSMKDIVEQCIQSLSASIPGDVADIKIEGIFKFSPDSSLLLLTLPTAVWSMLRRNHSFDFVGVIQAPRGDGQIASNGTPYMNHHATVPTLEQSLQILMEHGQNIK
ncbi:hypothetical protein RIB2604_01901240 [Aspergillus luchuensis]|uniref:Uncharacterized protein n=1 Tax=Aspergillus kawachii TaxID=1069201 RepID=A0A146FI58_ASPKA|nr:hypothetical protein RIB2604_01901240 [Aspergillus luchuensis]